MQEHDLSLDSWFSFIREVIRKYGSRLHSVQITNEPNLTFMDGSKPYVLQALIQGVIAAKQAVSKNNFQITVGIGSVPDGPKTIPHFWENVALLGGESFYKAVDYVGYNFYVDVFEEPLSLEKIPRTVERLLKNFRENNLKTGNIPASIPIRITENGWPTGKNPFVKAERTYEHQSSVIDAVVRTIYGLRQELNITHYELFGLRDADSSKDDLFHQFGIMRDDYTSKPAFEIYCQLIQEMGT